MATDITILQPKTPVTFGQSGVDELVAIQLWVYLQPPPSPSVSPTSANTTDPPTAWNYLIFAAAARANDCSLITQLYQLLGRPLPARSH